MMVDCRRKNVINGTAKYVTGRQAADGENLNDGANLEDVSGSPSHPTDITVTNGHTDDINASVQTPNEATNTPAHANNNSNNCDSPGHANTIMNTSKHEIGDTNTAEHSSGLSKSPEHTSAIGNALTNTPALVNGMPKLANTSHTPSPTHTYDTTLTHTYTDTQPPQTPILTDHTDTPKPHSPQSQEDVLDENERLIEDPDKFLSSSSSPFPICSCRHAGRSPDIDGGWAWVVFVAAFIQFFISSAMYYSFSVYFVELVEAFDEPRAKVGWVYSTNSAVHMFCGPLGGWTISRWGPRPTVMLGGVLACLGYLASAFSPSLNVIFITYGVINGMGTSLNFSGWVVGLGRFWERRQCWVTGVAMAGSGVGVAVLGPAIAALVGHYGWRGAMLFSAGFSLNFCVLGATIFTSLAPPHHCRCVQPESEEGVEVWDGGGDTDSDAVPQTMSSLMVSGSVGSLAQAENAGQPESGPKSARVVARWPGFWLLQASCFLSFMATTTIFAVLLDWVQWVGLGAAFSAGLAGSGAGDVVGRVVAGAVAARGPPLLLFSGVQLVLATVVAGAALATSTLQFVAALVGVGVACGLQSVLHALLPSKLSSGAGVGHLLGWQLVVAGLGALAGPPTAGLLVDLTHSYSPVLILCTAAPATAAMLSLAAHCLAPHRPTS